MALATVAVLAPIHAVMLTVGALIFADLITGLLAARKRNESITSAALGRTVSKALVYQCAVISAYLVEKYMLADVFPAAKLVAGLIGVVELTSILENAEKTLGVPIFRTIIQRLTSKNDAR
jgi:phage-related holin